MKPAERLKNQRHGVRSSTPKYNGTNRNPLWIIRLNRQRRIVFHRRGEPAIRMRGIFPTIRNPGFSFPVDQVWRWRIVFSFPPDIPVRCAGHIGEDGIPSDRFHRIGIRFFIRSRSDAKITVLWIDRMETTIRAWFHPSDVIPDGCDLPPFVRIGRNHHRKVRLSTSRRKSCCHISFMTRRILDAQNKHMLG